MLSISASIHAMKDQEEPAAEIPDYRDMIHVPNAGEADQWGWEWDHSPSEPSDGVSKLPTSHRKLRQPIGRFRQRIQASDRPSEALTAHRNLPTAYPSFPQAIGSSDSPSEASDRLSEALIRRRKVPTGCRKLGYAV